MIDKDIKYKDVPQLVKPRKDGKRPGYRGDAAYGASSRSTQATSIGQARGATGPGGGGSLGDGRDTNERPATQYIGGKEYKVTPETREERELQTELLNEEKQKLIDSFINTPAEYNKFIPPYVKLAAEFNRVPNREFFVQNVLDNPYSMSQEEIENAYQGYMDSRMSGATDAYGNPIIATGGGQGQSQLQLLQQQAISNPLQNTTVDSLQGGVGALYAQYMRNLGYTL